MRAPVYKEKPVLKFHVADLSEKAVFLL